MTLKCAKRRPLKKAMSDAMETDAGIRRERVLVSNNAVEWDVH